MSKKKPLVNLQSVLNDNEQEYTKNFDILGMDIDVVQEINIEDISPNPYQPRKNFDPQALSELSESIKRHGLIQPIIVLQKENGFILIAGERRLRAAKIAGLDTIKAVVAEIGTKNLRELALIENIQRAELNPIELANSYKELINEHKITQEDLSNIIKKSRTQITNTMRLLSLSKNTQMLIENGKLSQGHAKIIVGLTKEQEEIVIDTVIGQKLNVRQTEDLVKKIKATRQKIPKNIIDQDYIEELNKLKKSLNNFGIKSKISNKKIILDFNTIEQIKHFIEKIY